ncbi:DMT family transporter [Myxococcus sp. K15C18031901]|uniref:DMT family transporter n=1 Tax=Myxococcus dinghuensis TaxID=2906761 RepID=UPI0020A6FE73|nr:DMT family transporter [Myxococcus dinghuensis]MCP3097402.1 DMT family transporter [Myxococcus dinghuensis]
MSAPSLVRPAVPSLPAAWLTPVELGVLGAMWGSSFMLMRVAAKDFGPLPLVAMRLTLGALVLLPLLARARGSLTRRLLPALALVGALNAAVPFSLFAWAAQRAPAGVGAITNSLAVLFTALVAFLFFGETIGARRAVSLLAGFAGVVVLASGKVAGASLGWAVAAGVSAAFMYGVAANLARRYLNGIPPGATAASTLALAAVMVWPFALATWPEHAIPAVSWGAASVLGVFGTGIGYVMFYRLIQRLGPARAATVTYLVPLFAVAWAWLLLDEPLTPTMALAGALILGGVALGQRKAT